MFTHRTLAVVGVLAATLSLSACAVNGTGMGMGDDSTSGQSADTNNADLAFTMMMIPHHEQAIEMADLILRQDGIDQRVLDLAQQIKDAQAPEIELMQGWLDEWGYGSMDGMDHGGGMMSDDDMSALEDASGSEASRLFLTQMIEHHVGAIEMAEEELDGGINPDVRELCERIIASQTAEIDTMKQILATL